MNKEKIFERMLELLYEAMLDDSRWPAASALIEEACGFKGSALVFGRGNSRSESDLFFSRICYGGERRGDLEQRYFGTYFATDVRIPRIQRLPNLELAHVDSLMTDTEKKSSALYNEFLPEGEGKNGLTVRLDGFLGSPVVWTTADPVDNVGWSRVRLQEIERFLPHLRQFAQVRGVLSETRVREATFASLLESLNCGVIQLDRRGRILGTNDRSQALLNAADGLVDKDTELHAARPPDDDNFQKLLARALPRNREPGIGGSISLRLRGHKKWLAVQVTPVPRASATGAGGRVAALVLTTRLGHHAHLNHALIREALELTDAESELAMLLTKGHALPDIARITGRSYETLRWHLKNIFRKHGISNQTELVRLVISLGVIGGAPR